MGDAFPAPGVRTANSPVSWLAKQRQSVRGWAIGRSIANGRVPEDSLDDFSLKKFESRFHLYGYLTPLRCLVPVLRRDGACEGSFGFTRNTVRVPQSGQPR